DDVGQLPPGGQRPGDAVIAEQEGQRGEDDGGPAEDPVPFGPQPDHEFHVRWTPFVLNTEAKAKAARPPKITRRYRTPSSSRRWAKGRAAATAAAETTGPPANSWPARFASGAAGAVSAGAVAGTASVSVPAGTIPDTAGTPPRPARTPPDGSAAPLAAGVDSPPGSGAEAGSGCGPVVAGSPATGAGMRGVEPRPAPVRTLAVAPPSS